jgi:tetratricopeptide (TPR) repeat protein
MTLLVKGKDAENFISRQASNSLKDSCYAAFLKPKGQIVSLCFIEKSNGDLEITCQNPELLKEHLEKFIIVDDVEIEISDKEQNPKVQLEGFAEDQSIIKLEEKRPGVLEKYVDFTKGCFPGQEVLSKFKNIGLKKKEERSKKFTDEALEIFAQAKNNQEDLDPAIDLLKRALKENPRNEDAYESLGVMLAKQEKFPAAIAIMQQLEMINPKNQMALMNLSIFYMKIGDKETAEEYKAKGTVLKFQEALKETAT